MKIGTLTTGAAVVTTINLNYLPQYIYFIAATGLTSIKISVAGDGVILDLDTNGIAGVSGIRRFGAVANSYYIPLADGLIPNKVVTMTFTNSAAQTPDIYGHSLQKGSMYYTHLQQTALSSSGAIFKDFSHLCVEAMATTDSMTVEYMDGTSQDYESTELLGEYTLYSNEVDSYCIDNLEQNVRSVKLIPAADRTVVVTKWQPVGKVA